MSMKGKEETLIMDKTLTKTDVDEGQSRLSIPTSSLLSQSFVTCCSSSSSVKKHKKGKSLLYLLAKANSFKEGDMMQLWSFRSNQKLCFEIALRRRQGRLLGN
ncbi:unnamed protein product [Cochlearia groenlandica]